MFSLISKLQYLLNFKLLNYIMSPSETYILSKPEPWKSILMELQAVIKNTVPEVQESFKWNLPFYTLYGKMFCFLNFRKNFIDVGFPSGILISVRQDKLVAGEKRKNLRSLRYQNLEEVNIKILQEILLDVSQNKNIYE